jgi:hypothetical protein
MTGASATFWTDPVARNPASSSTSNAPAWATRVSPSSSARCSTVMPEIVSHGIPV